MYEFPYEIQGAMQKCTYSDCFGGSFCIETQKHTYLNALYAFLAIGFQNHTYLNALYAFWAFQTPPPAESIQVCPLGAGHLGLIFIVGV